jgi:exosortase E/protease (VPEID-CTERM system)
MTLRRVSAIEPTRPSTFRSPLRPALSARAAALALALLLEKYFLNLFIDIGQADAATGFGETVRVTQHITFSFAITLALSLAAVILVERDPQLGELGDEARRVPLRAGWIGLHLTFLALLAASLTLWYGPNGTGIPFWARVSGSALLASAAFATLLIGLAPLSLWRRAAAALGSRWLYAGAAATVATFVASWSQGLWGLATNTTFVLVGTLVRPFVTSLYLEPAAYVLATDRFAVQVLPYCSGLEGVGLMLAFTCAWLLYFRRDYIFPRALLLIPAGLMLIFALNAVRIAGLLLIGNAGYPGVAIYGFHSWAGWIAFNIAAGGLAFLSHESPWLNRAARERSGPTANPTAAYLMPFLLLLIAGVTAQAMSSGFETLYGLRLLAAVAALAFCRRHLAAALDWRFGWRGLTVGMLIFVLWLGAAHVMLNQTGMPEALARMSAWERLSWIGVRAATSILVVPIAEELAYRGYLLRRLVASDFEAVPWAAVGWGPLVLSSVLFAVLHDALWWPALGAGLAYGLLLRRTGRLGEAVAAHAATNALITLWVVGFGQWQLWS